METIDFMDPKRRRQHEIMLVVGYVLVGIAIVLVSVILLFSAYGFGLKNGQVVQSGLVFISSTPHPAQIYTDGVRAKSDTNTKLVMQAGTYHFVLRRAGYRDWQRDIAVQGGQVQSYVYPFLFPSTLTTMTKKEYGGQPSLVAESPDKRWLVVGYPTGFTQFDVFDLNEPKKEPTPLTMPTGLLQGGTSQSLSVLSWADDNDHFLMKHTFDGHTEYLLIRRSDSTQSVNLTHSLNLETDAELTLDNSKFDSYIVYSPSKQTLSSISLSAPTSSPLIAAKVLAYYEYGDNRFVYVTPDPADSSKAIVSIYADGTSYPIHQVAAGQAYALKAAMYDGNLYVAVALPSEHVAYLYENPITQITNKQLGVAVPIRAFRLTDPNFLAFSDSGQYVVIESGQSLATYDAENDQSYTYTLADSLDQPQTHAVWMDDARLVYVSHKQIVAVDYDGNNRQLLITADAAYEPAFDQGYKTLYDFMPSVADPTHRLLTSTSLRMPADQ